MLAICSMFEECFDAFYVVISVAVSCLSYSYELMRNAILKTSKSAQSNLGTGPRRGGLWSVIAPWRSFMNLQMNAISKYMLSKSWGIPPR